MKCHEILFPEPAKIYDFAVRQTWWVGGGGGGGGRWVVNLNSQPGHQQIVTHSDCSCNCSCLLCPWNDPSCWNVHMFLFATGKRRRQFQVPLCPHRPVSEATVSVFSFLHAHKLFYMHCSFCSVILFWWSVLGKHTTFIVQLGLSETFSPPGDVMTPRLS